MSGYKYIKTYVLIKCNRKTKEYGINLNYKQMFIEIKAKKCCDRR